MRLSFVAIILGTAIISLGKAVAANPDVTASEWSHCTKDADCVVIQGECDWKAVNHNFADQAQQDVNNRKPTVDCMPGGYDGPKPEAGCIESECKVLDFNEDSED